MKAQKAGLATTTGVCQSKKKEKLIKRMVCLYFFHHIPQYPLYNNTVVLYEEYQGVW